METFNIKSLEQVPLGLTLLFQRLNELEAKIMAACLKPDTPAASDELLTRTEVKTRLKVSYPTLRDWTISGKIPSIQIGTTIRYNWADVQAAFTKIKPATI
jgi:excisionase family DNA binding protein